MAAPARRRCSSRSGRRSTKRRPTSRELEIDEVSEPVPSRGRSALVAAPRRSVDRRRGRGAIAVAGRDGRSTSMSEQADGPGPAAAPLAALRGFVRPARPAGALRAVRHGAGRRPSASGSSRRTGSSSAPASRARSCSRAAGASTYKRVPRRITRLADFALTDEQWDALDDSRSTWRSSSTAARPGRSSPSTRARPGRPSRCCRSTPGTTSSRTSPAARARARRRGAARQPRAAARRRRRRTLLRRADRRVLQAGRADPQVAGAVCRAAPRCGARSRRSSPSSRRAPTRARRRRACLT